jgi:hypothetical protein
MPVAGETVESTPSDLLDDTARREHETARGTTLDDVLRILGPQVLYAACTPDGVRGRIGEPVIHGSGETIVDQPDGILLAVGGPPESPSCVDAIRQAAAAGYRAVVVKAHGQDFTAAARAAQAARIALLVAPDHLPWRRIDALICAATDAVTAERAGYSGVGATDLFTLANEVAYGVGGATTIEDPRGRVLAYSTLPHQEIDEVRRQAILNRQTPDRPTNSDEYEKVCRAEGAVRFGSPRPGHLDRLAIAVRAGSQLLGLLWVCADEAALGPDAGAALSESAKIAALHLLRLNDHRAGERWSRSDILASFLQGTIATAVAEQQLGLDPGLRASVLAIAPARRETPGAAASRFVDLIGLYCQAWHPKALCTQLDGVVYMLLPLQPDDRHDLRLLNFANEVASAIERGTSCVVHVGIGDPVERLRDLPNARRSADRVLLALTESADSIAVATVDQVRSRILLRELAEQAEAVSFLSGPVQQIIAYDQEHSTTYAATLLTYLDVFGEAARAAAVVCVHENTLRYRIRRVQEMFGLDLGDAETRLVTWLQLKVLRLSEG